MYDWSDNKIVNTVNCSSVLYVQGYTPYSHTLPYELHITTLSPHYHMNSILPHELHITTWTPHYHMNSTSPHELHIAMEKTPKVNTEDVLSFAGTYFRGQLSSNQFAGINIRATSPEILRLFTIMILLYYIPHIWHDTSGICTFRQVNRGCHV